MARQEAVQEEIAERLLLAELKEDLVRRADAFFTEDKKKPNDLGYKQIRNLVDLAAMSDCVLELKSFIRYQIGRDNQGKSWRGSFHNGREFGLCLLDEIDAVVKLAESKGSKDKSFTLKVLAYYFGFLGWRVKYIEAQSPRGE
ncbi:hypothetical protein GTO91_12950 [Heliobacterium undosum]|uniref:Uncharacterized protein n=1 Tax=Heliomicrobium undosum TaxID=121734 RepID=A0A845L243_9FIRM|nr:hypothetical protein [Heliomicrobium undosum]MZP30622.1 hypothetical protein [Heliomicrobium undosum]